MINDLSALEPQRYPALAADIEAAYAVLAPRLDRVRACALEARKAERKFWLGFAGGCVLGLVLAFAGVFSGAAAFLLLEGGLVLTLAALVFSWRRKGARARSLAMREARRVEQLLEEGFRCLGRIGVYARSPHPVELLEERTERLARPADGTERP